MQQSTLWIFAGNIIFLIALASYSVFSRSDCSTSSLLADYTVNGTQNKPFTHHQLQQMQLQMQHMEQNILQQLKQVQSQVNTIQQQPQVTPSPTPSPTPTPTTPILARKKRNAVFTLLSTDYYTELTRTLGYSLKKVNTSGELIAVVLPAVSNRSVCLLKAAGWQVLVLDPVGAPRTPILEAWKDQFTKLLLWNLTQFDSIFYLDSDTVVLENFDEVFDSPAEFSAVGDINGGQVSWTFNAGVFVLHPNTATFEKLIKDIHQVDKYDTGKAEQAFLNWWYEYTWLRLPYAYNGNLAFYKQRRDMWDRFGPIKVVHYTLGKPIIDVKVDSTDDPIYVKYFDLYKEMEKTYDGHCN